MAALNLNAALTLR